MYLSLILSIVIGLVLLGLVRSTETILHIRQRRRDQGHDPKIYL
jgi:hypothetical protein